MAIQVRVMNFKIFLEEIEGDAQELASKLFESDLWFNYNFVPKAVSDKIKVMPQTSKRIIQ